MIWENLPRRSWRSKVSQSLSTSRISFHQENSRQSLIRHVRSLAESAASGKACPYIHSRAIRSMRTARRQSHLNLLH